MPDLIDITIPNPNPAPDCPTCDGTGWDALFGNACICERFVGRTPLAQRLAGAEGARAAQALTQRVPSGNGGGAQRTSGVNRNLASDKQNAWLRTLATERLPEGDPMRDDILTAIERNTMTKRNASEYIDACKARPRIAPAAGTPAPLRTNRWAGNCNTCGAHVAEEAGRIQQVDGRWRTFHLDGGCPAIEDGIDLTPLKQFTSRGLVRFAVPGGDTRLKVRVKFHRNGTVYVDDGAEYGQRRNYGRQMPGRPYAGDITDALRAIVADPAAAILAYSALTGNCGVCGTHIEAETSVERGIGPVCRRKLGL